MAAADVLIIGGGAIGLAIALELQLCGASVTVLSRDFAQAASHAAAGMLAPQAEMIATGAMRELCLLSRSLYPDWTQKLEALTGLSTGYWACGILAPMYRKDKGERIKDETTDSSVIMQPSEFLDRTAIHQHQPGLSQEVSGGWWYPDDAQVDNRLLTKALWTAVREVGVDLREGVSVETILQQNQRITGVQTSSGIMQSEQYVLATGAWSQTLLSIPVTPRKGQMLSVRVPAGQQELPLQTVLFGSEIYIVPRRDGRIVIGATSEGVGFTPNNTPEGVQMLLERATRLYPALRQFPLQETWWGFRPATPDELPLLGASPYDNLTLATGHYRNGILLAPITAQLLADRLWHQHSHPLLDAFHWLRFKVE
ncbi:MAG: glycine oxidase ThiO [Tildeniella nuda ZEHNDER 1965/U140]|jgi:thiazole synthase|nr:glycine oxidase ThiO [Tildeniella nuda ZEHNDER 1965/U140]